MVCVSPFEHHSEGNGSLRATGLNEGNWRSWVEEMTRLKDQHSYASQKLFVQTANDVCKDLLAKGDCPMIPNQRMPDNTYKPICRNSPNCSRRLNKPNLTCFSRKG